MLVYSNYIFLVMTVVSLELYNFKCALVKLMIVYLIKAEFFYCSNCWYTLSQPDHTFSTLESLGALDGRLARS